MPKSSASRRFSGHLIISVAHVQGTVLIRSAEELQGYSRSEEDRLEALVKGIADTGAKVVVAGSAIGDMALHFVEKYGMMAVRIPSKFDLRRFCRCLAAPALPFPPASPAPVCSFTQVAQHTLIMHAGLISAPSILLCCMPHACARLTVHT